MTEEAREYQTTKRQPTITTHQHCYTYLAITALRSIRGQSRVHHVQAEVHLGNPAGLNAPTSRPTLLWHNELVSHLTHTLHTELKALIEVLTVHHTALAIARGGIKGALGGI